LTIIVILTVQYIIDDESAYGKQLVLTVPFQSDVVGVRGVVQRERDVVRLRQVQHGLQEQIARVVQHDAVRDLSRRSPSQQTRGRHPGVEERKKKSKSTKTRGQ